MSHNVKRLTAVAEEEVRTILTTLPQALRGHATALPIVYDTRTIEELDEDEVGDTLGLFVGANFVEAGEAATPLPPQIILYLNNLWWAAEDDEAVYRREVRTTFLHELGHYLGLEEIDLDERGLG